MRSLTDPFRPVVAAGERQHCGPLWMAFNHKMLAPFAAYRWR
jgi:hypothetical protein